MREPEETGRIDAAGIPAGRATRTHAILTAILLLSGTVGAQDERATRVVECGALHLAVPAHWRVEEPRLRMRYSQFSIRKTYAKVETVKFLAEIPPDPSLGRSPPAEVAVFHFGRKGAGSLRSIVDAWVDQFGIDRPDIERDRRVTRLQGKREGGTYTLVDVSGTYFYNVGPRFRFEAELVHGARMLAAVVPTENGPYYVKLTGRERNVAAAEAEFRAMFGGDAKSEILLDPELRRQEAAVHVRFELFGRPFAANGLRVRLGKREATCTDEGARFEGVRPGKHQLDVHRIEGFRLIRPREVEVKSGEAVEIVIALEPYDC